MDVSIAKDHPSLVGHFPGNPVVPGVVILDKVRLAIQSKQPGFRISHLPNVKFLHPLLPAQQFQIEIEEHQNKYRFSCRTNNSLIAQGEIKLEFI
jgi:3-hydroxymyristoyl/3-hydroxydecanoyl-(acyl carrier protein) dehydratase